MQSEIEQRVQKARELHANGCNCCQAVVMAYADKLPVDAQSAMQMAQPFGRGLSGLKQTCGCVNGMAMVCGLVNQTMMFKGLATQFLEEQGSINCFELLKNHGTNHSCNDLVACAARLMGESIL